jgi:hypothetical protein
VTDDLSESSRSLLRAARTDAPTSAKRGLIWRGVMLTPPLTLVGPRTVHAASLAHSPAQNAAGGLLSAGKLLVAGALAGSALTIGIGVAVFGSSRTDGRVAASAPHERSAARPATLPPVPVSAPVAEGHHVVEPVIEVVEIDSPSSNSTRVPAQTAAPQPAAEPTRSASMRGAGIGGKARGEGDALMREALLVAQAREDILAGSPSSALDALDGARATGSRSLEPEELSLRARALRMLGREGEASRVESALSSRFPESFLAR